MRETRLRCCRNAHAARAGEAQKIDRIMEKFAERFCRDNPGAFASADGAYLLAFALIMLNTDAHNPHADKKLGAADFISMAQVQVRLTAMPHALGCACWAPAGLLMLGSSFGLSMLGCACLPRS